MPVPVLAAALAAWSSLQLWHVSYALLLSACLAIVTILTLTLAHLRPNGQSAVLPGEGPGLPLRRALAGACAGCLLANGFMLDHVGRLPPVSLEGHELTVRGTVIGLPKQDSHRVRFDLLPDPDAGFASAGSPPGRWRLHWYDTPQRVEVGTRWRLRVVLQPRSRMAGPGLRDPVPVLVRENVVATGRVKAGWQLDDELGSASAAGLRSTVDKLRGDIGSRLATLESRTDTAGLLTALAVGDGSRVDPRTREILQDSGTAHLLAISGLHISLVAGMGFAGGRLAWRLRRLLIDRRLRARRDRERLLPRPRPPGTSRRDAVAAVCGLVAASTYALLAGFALPTQRALVMLLAVTALLLARRSVPASTAWYLALAAVLLLDVEALLAPGTWLSFGTVALLLWLHAGRPAAAGRLRTAWRLHARLGILLLPITAWFFGSGSLVAPLANLIAVPLVGILVVPAVLLLATLVVLLPESGETLAAPLCHALEWLLGHVLTLLAGLLELPAASLPIVLPTREMFLASLAGVLLLLAPRGGGLRLVALPLLLPALAFNAWPRAVDGIEVHVLDVGQGLAALILTGEHTVLVDTGDRPLRGESLAERVVLPALHHLGRRRIDHVIVSHADRDHAGGVEAIARHFPAAVWHTSEPGALPVAGARPCRVGKAWSLDGVWFTFLHPAAGDAGSRNDRSCVLLVHHGRSRVLFPGDIEAAAERRLVQRGAVMPLTLLVSPHHGSDSSSSRAFVDAMPAAHVIHAAGRGNRFGFPHDAARLRYTVSGAREHITGRDGSLAFRLDRDGLLGEPSRWRPSHRRWWNR